jgi:hypothetical protein
VTRLSVPPVVSRLVLQERQQVAAEQNQEGELFLEDIELHLHVFDDVIDQALRRKVKSAAIPEPAQAEAGVMHALRAVRAAARQSAAEGHEALDEEALKSAAARFAAAVVPQGVGDAPERYLRTWLDVYTAGGKTYGDAKDRMLAEVRKALEPFIRAAVERWSNAMPRAVAALLHTSEDSTIEGTITEAVQVIAETSMTNFRDGRLLGGAFARALAAATNDPYRDMRQYLYGLLRRPGEENVFKTAGKPENRLFRLPLMPLLAGDNPTSNTLPSKFLRLTDYQLYILRQWAAGLFYNEIDEGWVPDTAVDPYLPYTHLLGNSARDLDRGVLMNMLGGAFFPGAEVCWVIRNPSIFKEPYRLKADPDFYVFGQTAANASKLQTSEAEYLGDTGVDLSQSSNFKRGLQPGDLTKYSALPWQADFNECSQEPIGDRFVWWWPVQRPTFVHVKQHDGHLRQVPWVGTDQDQNAPNYVEFADDLDMVTHWKQLGFVFDEGSGDRQRFVEVERTLPRHRTAAGAWGDAPVPE